MTINKSMSVNDGLVEIVQDLFNKTMSERRADSIEAMNRELPKICEILDMDINTMKPIIRKKAA